MAVPRGKVRSVELSPVKQTAKKSKDSQSLNEEKMEQLVERLVDERLETCLEVVLDRVFDRKLNTMLEKIEERFSSTIDKRLTDMVTYVDSVSASSEDQMDILKQKIANLELRADMSEVEGNLIISGIEEAIDEDVKVRVLDLVQNELKVNISEQEIVSAFRLPNGQRAAPRQTSTSPTNSPTSAVNRDAPASQSTPLPRRILVKTVSHISKAKIMRAKSALVKRHQVQGNILQPWPEQEGAATTTATRPRVQDTTFYPRPAFEMQMGARCPRHRRAAMHRRSWAPRKLRNASGTSLDQLLQMRKNLQVYLIGPLQPRHLAGALTLPSVQCRPGRICWKPKPVLIRPHLIPI